MNKKKQPPIPQVPLELWRELFEAARRFQAMAPWKWMFDTYVLGLQNEHGVRLLSVLGANRTLFGMVAYRGTRGTNHLLHLLNGEVEPESPENRYIQDVVIMDLGAKSHLEKLDLELVKAVGYQPLPQKPLRYPYFRSHLPGFYPWLLNEAEVRMFLDSLQKEMDFAFLVQRHPGLFEKRGPGQIPFFPANHAGPIMADQLEWHTLVPTEPAQDPPLEVPPQALELLVLPLRAKAIWELDSFYVDMPTYDGGERIYWPIAAMIADARSGLVSGLTMETWEGNMARAAGCSLVKAMMENELRPGTVKVCSANLAQALAPLAAALKIKLVEVLELPAMEEARYSMESFITRQKPY